MKQLLHTGHSLIGFSLIVLLALTACDSSGENPIGSFLGSTSQKIQYWEGAGNRFSGSTVRCITLDNNGNLLIAVKDSGIFLSSTRGTLWSSISNGLPERTDVVSILAASNDKLYAITDTLIYRANASAPVWSTFTNGIAENTIFYGLRKSYSERPFLATSTGLYTLASDNVSWEPITSGLPQGVAIVDIDLLPNGMSVAITSKGAVYRSLDATGGWVPVYLPFYVDSAYSVTQNPSGDLCLLLQSRRFVVYRNDNEIDLNQRLYAEEIKFFNGIGFLLEVEEFDNDPYSNDIKRYKMMRSIDGGVNWAPIYTGLVASVIDFVFDSNGNGYAVLSNGSVQRTSVPIK